MIKKLASSLETYILNDVKRKKRNEYEIRRDILRYLKERGKTSKSRIKSHIVQRAGRYLDILCEKGYVTVEIEGKTKRYIITEEGLKYLQKLEELISEKKAA
jgi:predicted transcriptional regulator